MAQLEIDVRYIFRSKCNFVILQGTGSGPGTSGAGTGMETDQLISSLPELGEDLGQDIMQTILNNKEQQQQQQQQQDPLWLWSSS